MRKPVDDAGDERHDGLDQLVVELGPASLGHQGVELAELRVRYAAALAEAAHDLVLDRCRQPDELQLPGDVAIPCATTQHRGPIVGQHEPACRGLVVDDTADRRSGMPFAHVATLTL